MSSKRPKASAANNFEPRNPPGSAAPGPAPHGPGAHDPAPPTTAVPKGAAPGVGAGSASHAIFPQGAASPRGGASPKDATRPLRPEMGVGPTSVRDLAELPPPETVAHAALNRAKAAARDRGVRPGRSRTSPLAEQRSGARRDGRDPKLLSDTLGFLLRERGWVAEVSVGGVIGRWREVVGDDIADHSTPLTFDDHILVVRAHSTAWATQLRLLTPQILQTIARELGDGVVTDVQVKGPVGRSFGRGPRAVKGRGPRDTWG